VQVVFLHWAQLFPLTLQGPKNLAQSLTTLVF
jgi:hypothetical protein